MYNGHADVTALLTADGTIVASYYYDAFGTVLEKNENKGINNPYRYAGYVFDNATSLYYLNARYYDSKIARFMSEDTYTGEDNDPLSLNLYTYCHNEPVMYYDPSGHFAFTLGGIIKSITSSVPKEIPVPAIGANILGLTLLFTFTPQNTVTTEQEQAELEKYKATQTGNTTPYVYTMPSHTVSVPTTYSKPTQTWTPNTDVKPAVNGQYTVKPGDTLEVIAKANGTTVDEIAKINNISNPNKITSGQKLKMPQAWVANTSVTPATNGQYTVKYGDTLSVIAKANGTTVENIVKANNISDPNKIYAGQKINIPQNGGSPSSNNNNNKNKANEITKMVIKEIVKETVKEVVGEGTSNTTVPKNRLELNKELTNKGFNCKGTTEGGYVEYKHTDGTTVWVRPDGEIITVKKEWLPDGSKKVPVRYNWDGTPVKEGGHNTGEFVEKIDDATFLPPKK